MKFQESSFVNNRESQIRNFVEEITDAATVFVIYDENGEDQLGLTVSETSISLIYKKYTQAEDEASENTIVPFDLPISRGKYGTTFIEIRSLQTSWCKM